MTTVVEPHRRPLRLLAADLQPIAVVWPRVVRVADRMTAGLRNALLVLFRDLRASIDLDALAIALMRSDMRRVAELTERVPDDLAPELADRLAEAAQRAARVAGPTVGEIRPDYDVVNEAAVAWAGRHAAERVTQISSVQRADMRAAIERGYAEGISPDRLARQLRAHIGLTTQQSRALDTYRLGLTTHARGSTPPSAKRVDQLLEQYAGRLLRQRADSIARTELLTAANMGQQILWERSADDGLLGVRPMKRWMVTADERTCARCNALDGQEVDLRASFADPTGVALTIVPPLHTRCRCTLTLA